jgi:hypothetical protein
MSDAISELWHVADGGKSFGPYTTNMLQDRINRRRFSKSALVWKGGFSSWQPIVLHFVVDDAPAVGHEKRRVTSAPAKRTPMSYIAWFILVVTGLLFTLVATGYSASNEWGASYYLLSRIGVVFAMLGLGAATAFLWWRKAGTVTNERRAGILRAVIVVGGSAIAIAGFAAAMNTPLLYRLQIARQSYNHYSVNVDVGTGVLSVKGLIGPGLASEVSRQLRANAAIKTVAINSTGGLVQEALDIAREVQNHGGLTTEVREACNSACILIFMSGEKRLAPYDLDFGFHATSSVTPLSGVYNLESLDVQGAEAGSYLVSRGVPKAFVSEAQALGPQKLYSVSAIRMADAGAVTGLLYDGQAVSVAKAKWLAVLDIEKRVHAPAALLNLFSVIAAVSPTSVEKYGPSLWRATQTGNAMTVAASMHGLVGELAARAIPASDDEALALVVKVTSGELQYLRAKGSWDACVGFINGKGFGLTKPPQDFVEADLTAQTALIISAAHNEWKVKEIPGWISAVGAALAKPIAIKMVAAGVNLQNLDSDPRASCEWTTDFLATIAQKPAPLAANLYRWLASGAK